MKTWVAAIVLCFWLGDAASAQTPAGTLHVSAQADFLESARGGSGGISWVNPLSAESGFDLGAVSGAIGQAWWTYGRLGGFTVVRRVLVSGTLDSGGGASEAGRFGYHRIRGEVGVPLASKRILAEGEAQVSRMASDVRRVLRAGTSWQVTPETTLRASYYSLTDGGVTSPVLSARIDVNRGKLGVLGGMVRTRHGVVPLLASQLGASSLSSNEVFAGCRFPLRSRDLQIVIDSTSAPNRALRVLSSVKIPLRSRSTPTNLDRSSTPPLPPERDVTGR